MQLVRTLIVACIAYGKNRCAMRAQSDFIMAIGKLLQITVQAYQNCFHYGTFDRIMLNYNIVENNQSPKTIQNALFCVFFKIRRVALRTPCGMGEGEPLSPRINSSKFRSPPWLE